MLQAQAHQPAIQTQQKPDQIQAHDLQAGFYVPNSTAHSIRLEQLLEANRGGSPSEVLDLSTLEADLDLSPTDSSSSLDLGKLQAQAQRPAPEAQLPGTGQQQAQQSSATQQNGEPRAIQWQAPVRATMSCIIPNCTYVTTPGYDQLQQLVPRETTATKEHREDTSN